MTDDSFQLDGMALRPCYNSGADEIGGCLDEAGEFQACEDCKHYGECPITGGDEEE